MVMKIGIIGCGKMADNHAAQIQYIPETKIVAVCDREPLLAKDMAARFGIERHFGEAREMLEAAKFDVIHITTPPQSHYDLGRMCLEADCNVYMEKPFTVNSAEAEALIDLAEKRNLKITAGHNAQFSYVMREMRELVMQGFLGGKPVHMESHYCYDFGDANYAKALLGDAKHWVRLLPGSLLQNIISHGISKIAEFLPSNHPKVLAHGWASAFLKEIGEGDIVDEVRVIIYDDDGTTAYFTFSSQIKPPPRQFILYGKKNSLILDEDHQVLVKVWGKEHKSYMRYVVPPLGYAMQYISNVRRNFVKFLKKDFFLPNDAGLRVLIGAFYKSIVEGSAAPISYREILLTTWIMDEIFRQVRQLRGGGEV